MAILIVLFLALVISIISALPFRGREPSVVTVILIFIILAMAGLVAQYWIMPFGPLICGVSLMTILIIAFLLATPSPHQRRIKGAKGEEQKVVKAAASIGGLMWTLLFLLSAAVLIGYFRAP